MSNPERAAAYRPAKECRAAGTLLPDPQSAGQAGRFIS